MKLLVTLLGLVLAQSTWALDVKFNLIIKPTPAKTSAMTCEGRTCSCPADTDLDVNSKLCMKCDAGLVLNKDRKECTDPSQPSVFEEKGVTYIQGMAVDLIAAEVKDPEICDIKSVVNGKYEKCQCNNEVLDYSLDGTKNGKFSIVIKRAFNKEQQKCVRTGPYEVKVADISCYGPRRGSFDKLKSQGFIDLDYDSPGMSLASCGFQDGTHVITIKNEEKMFSVLDALVVTAQTAVQYTKFKSIEIDPKSLNY